MRTPLASVAFIALSAPFTGAAAQTYIGIWGVSPAQCVVDQSRQDAPMIMRRNRYDQHETHCTFVNIRKSGDTTWRVRARCTVEGDRQMHTFTMSVTDAVMTVREGRAARTLVRCR
jgi:hypothetical protein